jgi:spectinomycin phosphotransferase
VRDRPAGVGERELGAALAEGWLIHPVDLRYAPVGGGSYHWEVRDHQDGQWFVTVDDLDDKPWLGHTRTEVGDGLRVALDTAVALRDRAGLQFVAAPIPAVGGQTVLPIGSRYAVAVYPFIQGTSGQFGVQPPAAERSQIVDMLAALHEATPTAARARVAKARLPQRDALEAALGELDRPWHGGPYSEPAREMLSGSAGQIRRTLKTFDRLAAQFAGDVAPELVITHGEPHPANIMRAGNGMMLIDWDTVGLAPPERDLWMLVTDSGDEARRYTQASGRPVDRDALEFYRIRWALDDIAAFMQAFRKGHRQTPQTEHMWHWAQSYFDGRLPWPGAAETDRARRLRHSGSAAKRSFRHRAARHQAQRVRPRGLDLEHRPHQGDARVRRPEVAR